MGVGAVWLQPHPPHPPQPLPLPQTPTPSACPVTCPETTSHRPELRCVHSSSSPPSPHPREAQQYHSPCTARRVLLPDNGHHPESPAPQERGLNPRLPSSVHTSSRLQPPGTHTAACLGPARHPLPLVQRLSQPLPPSIPPSLPSSPVAQHCPTCGRNLKEHLVGRTASPVPHAHPPTGSPTSTCHPSPRLCHVPLLRIRRMQTHVTAEGQANGTTQCSGGVGPGPSPHFTGPGPAPNTPVATFHWRMVPS